jgi:hypothetical protein
MTKACSRLQDVARAWALVAWIGVCTTVFSAQQLKDGQIPRSLGRNRQHCVDLNDFGLGIKCAGELDLLSRVLFGPLLIV